MSPLGGPLGERPWVLRQNRLRPRLRPRLLLERERQLPALRVEIHPHGASVLEPPEQRLVEVRGRLAEGLQEVLYGQDEAAEIAYGTGRVSTRQMVREGLGLNLLGVGVIATVCLLTLGP